MACYHNQYSLGVDIGINECTQCADTGVVTMYIGLEETPIDMFCSCPAGTLLEQQEVAARQEEEMYEDEVSGPMDSEDM